MIDYNLLVSFREGKDEEAEDEMVKRVADVEGAVSDWNVSMDPQLYLVSVSRDPKNTVQRIRRLAEHFPDVFAYTLQWIPVDKWISTEEASIKDVITSHLEEFPEAGIDVKVLYSDAPNFQDKMNRMSRKGDFPTITIRIIDDTASISILQENEWLDIDQVRERVRLRNV